MDGGPVQGCSVVVVDDHPQARQALCRTVSSTPGLRLVACLDSGEGAVAYATAATARLLVVMDARMPGLGGVEAARQIVEVPLRHVVVLVSSDDDAAVGRAETVRTTFVTKARVTGGRLLRDWRAGQPP